jgi:Smg protein
MTESVLDVLMYLFETAGDEGVPPQPDRVGLRDELERAGFRDREIDRALEWLDGLALRRADEVGEPPTERAIRIYGRDECVRIDSHGRGYMMYLEQIGILSAHQRELVIDRLMALDCEEIDVDDIKWVVLMVLFSQPGEETAYARMEDLVFEDRAWVAH